MFKSSLILAVFLVFGFYNIVQANGQIGIVHQVEGSAYAVSEIGNKRKLKEGNPVFIQDTIHTSTDGIVIITLKNGSQIALDQNTELVLTKYSLTNKPDSFFEQTKGRLYSVVSKFFSKRNNSYRIKTKTAVVGVKGTEFLTEVFNSGTKVWVSSGLVEVTNIDPEIQGIIQLQRNQFTEVPEGKPPTEPQIFTPSIAPENNKGSEGEQLKDETQVIIEESTQIEQMENIIEKNKVIDTKINITF